MNRFNRLFADTYWGRNYPKQHNIIENRKQFIEEYKLKQRINNPNINLFCESIKFNVKHPHMDHIEQYITEDDKIVLVTSPYDYKTFDTSLNPNWIKYKDIYSNFTNTYILHMDKKFFNI